MPAGEAEDMGEEIGANQRIAATVVPEGGCFPPLLPVLLPISIDSEEGGAGSRIAACECLWDGQGSAGLYGWQAVGTKVASVGLVVRRTLNG